MEIVQETEKKNGRSRYHQILYILVYTVVLQWYYKIVFVILWCLLYKIFLLLTMPTFFVFFCFPLEQNIPDENIYTYTCTCTLVNWVIKFTMRCFQRIVIMVLILLPLTFSFIKWLSALIDSNCCLFFHYKI